MVPYEAATEVERNLLWMTIQANNCGLDHVEKLFLPKYAKGVGEYMTYENKILPDSSTLKVEFQYRSCSTHYGVMS